MISLLCEADDPRSAITTLFSRTPNPSDDEIHAVADRLGIDPSAFEEEIYSLLASVMGGIGRHKDVPDSEFDAKELAAGIKVEKEHTDNEEIAKWIAKDHLSELQDYYSRLDRMEKA